MSNNCLIPVFMKKEEEGKLFIKSQECFRKFGITWVKPSVCCHLDEEGLGFKQCIKCGRVVFEKSGRKFFYHPNGVRYLIKKKKMSHVPLTPEGGSIIEDFI